MCLNKKNIGFVSTWLERGATMVTKMYIQSLINHHNIYVFARGGEYIDRSLQVPLVKVTNGYRLGGTKIDYKQFKKWILTNKIDLIFFNEQSDIDIVYKTKLTFPKVIIGSYIDYYKENTIDEFAIYDFLICNTRRHYSVFSKFEQTYYVPWGVDLELFMHNSFSIDNEKLVFFHSMGMSDRKGTDVLIEAFIEGGFSFKNSKLIIHTQKNIDNLIGPLKNIDSGIEVILQEVKAPGLYHLGDIYVYPTKLDGLGLTMYEALSCGLPVIATNEAPMNEIINEEIGKLLRVSMNTCRSDAYYWPQAHIDKKSLIDAMNYYIENKNNLIELKMRARNYAEKNLNFNERMPEIRKIFDNVYSKDIELANIKKVINKKARDARQDFIHNSIEQFSPNKIKHLIRKQIEKRRYGNH